MRPVNDFEWDDLLDYVEERQVIPVTGRDLLTLALHGEARSLEQWLAEGLARDLKVPLEEGGAPTSLDAVAHAYFNRAGGQPHRSKVNRKLTSLLKAPDLPIPPALQQIAAIRDFNLFLSFGFDDLLERAIDQERFGGETTTSLLCGLLRHGSRTSRASPRI